MNAEYARRLRDVVPAVGEHALECCHSIHASVGGGCIRALGGAAQLKEGRVYDAFTGGRSASIEESRQLWQYPDAIKFGF